MEIQFRWAQAYLISYWKIPILLKRQFKNRAARMSRTCQDSASSLPTAGFHQMAHERDSLQRFTLKSLPPEWKCRGLLSERRFWPGIHLGSVTCVQTIKTLLLAPRGSGVSLVRISCNSAGGVIHTGWKLDINFWPLSLTGFVCLQPLLWRVLLEA